MLDALKRWAEPPKSTPQSDYYLARLTIVLQTGLVLSVLGVVPVALIATVYDGGQNFFRGPAGGRAAAVLAMVLFLLTLLSKSGRFRLSIWLNVALFTLIFHGFTLLTAPDNAAVFMFAIPIVLLALIISARAAGIYTIITLIIVLIYQLFIESISLRFAPIVLLGIVGGTISIYTRERERQETDRTAELRQANVSLEQQRDRIRRLYQLTTRTDLPSDDLFTLALKEGCDLFGMAIGIISHIEGSTYTVQHVYTPDGSIERGTTFELGKTYCAITVRSEDVIGIEQMATSPYKGHPAYEAFGLEAYLGVPLTVNGQPYGTLNFSAPHPQAAPFSEADRDFVRLMARWVSATIEQLLAEQRLREQAVRLADANKELAIARRRAEESNRLKSEFLATMSHELRTPLNAIIGFADIQLSGMAGELTGKQQHFTDRIMANGEHLLTLINNILDLSKIEAGRVEIVHDPFVPADLLEAIAGPMQGLADSKGLALKTVCDPNLPATLTGDPGRIKQVAINLLSNAIKFTDAGSVTMAFRRLDPHTWAIEVSDTGVGIPSHAQEMIFESFRQADSSTTRQHRGTGLGLAIVRNLAMLMGGQARVRSTPGEGSTFTVTLPLSVPTVQEEPHVH